MTDRIISQVQYVWLNTLLLHILDSFLHLNSSSLVNTMPQKNISIMIWVTTYISRVLNLQLLIWFSYQFTNNIID